MVNIISIIIPVYKVEKYLDKCIESVVNQTYKNLEIILVDDGSPDKCPEKCDNWAKRDDRIKVIHKQNGGLSDARNMGLDLATGDYIMFLDSDDYIESTTCEKLLVLLGENNSDFVACALNLFYENKNLAQNEDYKKSIKKFEGESVINYLYSANIPYLMISCAKLYRRNLFDSLRFPVGKLHEDEFIFHKILGKSSSFVYTNEKLYNYLQHERSIMANKKSEKSLVNGLEAFRDRFEFLQSNFPQNYEKNINLYLSQLRNVYIQTKIKKIKQKIIKEYHTIYKLNKKHILKDILFYYCRWMYIIISKFR